MSIQEALRKSAKELFSKKGYKKTNISDITKNAKLGTGTFYNYYASKAELFMELFMEENMTLKRHIMEQVDMKEAPLKVMKALMTLNLIGMQSNPILREWYNPDTFGKLERLFKKKKGMALFDYLYADFLDIITHWQETGKIRQDIDSKMIMAFFVSIINMDTHKEEIGLAFFPDLIDYMAGFVMKGIIAG